VDSASRGQLPVSAGQTTGPERPRETSALVDGAGCSGIVCERPFLRADRLVGARV